MNKTIFINGGAGYIGSHMVKYASMAGYDKAFTKLNFTPKITQIKYFIKTLI
jgi:UDP-glucose 4-epimerase